MTLQYLSEWYALKCSSIQAPTVKARRAQIKAINAEFDSRVRAELPEGTPERAIRSIKKTIALGALK